MYLVDANVLLYAANREAEHHREAADWLREALVGERPVGFAWVSMLAFLRISTHRGLHDKPLPMATALDLLETWTSAPSATVIAPTGRHAALLRGLLLSAGVGGNLVNDAHLAALAAEHASTVVTFDRDFQRFPGLATHRP